MSGSRVIAAVTGVAGPWSSPAARARPAAPAVHLLPPAEPHTDPPTPLAGAAEADRRSGRSGRSSPGRTSPSTSMRPRPARAVARTARRRSCWMPPARTSPRRSHGRGCRSCGCGRSGPDVGPVGHGRLAGRRSQRAAPGRPHQSLAPPVLARRSALHGAPRGAAGRLRVRVRKAVQLPVARHAPPWPDGPDRAPGARPCGRRDTGGDAVRRVGDLGPGRGVHVPRDHAFSKVGEPITIKAPK